MGFFDTWKRVLLDPTHADSNGVDEVSNKDKEEVSPENLDQLRKTEKMIERAGEEFNKRIEGKTSKRSKPASSSLTEATDRTLSNNNVNTTNRNREGRDYDR